MSALGGWLLAAYYPGMSGFIRCTHFYQRIHPMRPWETEKLRRARQQFTLFAQDHRFDKGQLQWHQRRVWPNITYWYCSSALTSSKIRMWPFTPHKKIRNSKKKETKSHTYTHPKKNHPSLLQQKISPTILPPPIPRPNSRWKKSAPRKASGFQLALVAFRIIPWYERKPKHSIVVFGKSLKNTIYLHWFLKKGVIQWPFTNWKHQEMLSIILEFYHLEFPDSIVSSFLAFSMCSCATTHAPRSEQKTGIFFLTNL